MANYYDITLALAGVCQSAKLVQQFAHYGEAEKASLQPSIQSLLKTSPPNTLAVYGGIEEIELGLTTLLEQFNGAKGEKDIELSRYWLSLLALESKLNKSATAKTDLAHRIQRLPSQMAYFDLFDEQMLANLAAIYVDVISPLGNKIQVKGNPIYLQQPLIQHQIRACLLAGIRSAVLWRQVGGTKWQILFSRRKIINQAQQFLSSIN
ncbi:high frequency lysogenization protein HflD [Volucribacter amazonae]|uniref:High frequency lysogenization protein HflD homolog n=1 Tax=Volucribacter amazonae TaxID=256731 RepID=A0A9X4PAS8_9PAST|nr:high frequency lysogenization protein HflD [Volucribacter amazonae]MDG6895638.1 lysogenization protein HflD [Volucribacter amazonae]